MKIALVTGSRKGIGFATGKMLAENGYRVIFSSRTDAAEIADTLKNIAELPNECYYIQCDISKEEDRKGIFDAIIEKEGRLDVLVNNAGVAPLVRRDLLEATQESFDRVLGINLYGTFFMCQEGARHMLDMKEKLDSDYSPKIINISSISAYTPSPNRPEYCVSKSGISMITMLFADRLAESGIGVFEVRPGIVETDMTKGVHEKYRHLIENGVTPIRRFGQPEDIAKTVLAACSGLLDFTIGQVLNADGGFHIRSM